MNLKMKFTAGTIAALQITNSFAEVNWRALTKEKFAELTEEKKSNLRGGYSVECGISAGILEYSKPKDIEGYAPLIKSVKDRAKIVGNKDYGAAYNQRVVKVLAPYIMVFADMRDKGAAEYSSLVSKLKPFVTACSSSLLTFMTPSEAARAQGKIHISIDPVKEEKGKLGAECVGAVQIIFSQPAHKDNPSADVMNSVNQRAIHQTYKYFDERQDADDFITMHVRGVQAVILSRNLGESFYQEQMGQYRNTVRKCHKNLEVITEDTTLTDFLKEEGKDNGNKTVALSCVGSGNFLLREFGNAQSNVKAIIDKATVVGNQAYGSSQVFAQKVGVVTAEMMRYADTIKKLNPDGYPKFVEMQEGMMDDCLRWKVPTVK